MTCKTCGTGEICAKGMCTKCYMRKYQQSEKYKAYQRAYQRKYYLTVIKPKLEAKKHDQKDGRGLVLPRWVRKVINQSLLDDR